MPDVVVTAGGRVTTHNILAIDFCRHGDVLANRETENVLGVGKREAVASVRGGMSPYVSDRAGHGSTHIAVLGEMTIFSVRGNSFQTWGSSTGFRSMQQQEYRRQ